MDDITQILRSVLREELQPIQQELKQLNNRVNLIEKDLGQVKEDLGQVKEELGQVKEELGQVKEDLGQVKETVIVMGAKQQIMYEQTARLSEYHSETMTKFEQLATKEDLEYFDKKISEHDREIFKLKQRA
ncbi:hypothetical protein [Sporosarcina sp. HYO08]|uniref:hypothetical protein n=1 Tax=Sporosarcina sp. HYO08 TaxID=1759557 RepID=UPI0007968497|nr:hypothetical protein [Sporosarcina sp. HYO08]KXH87508.1 hypothetical protein AU377_02775 [Sporosarcina sp. HYO08]